MTDLSQEYSAVEMNYSSFFIHFVEFTKKILKHPKMLFAQQHLYLPNTTMLM